MHLVERSPRVRKVECSNTLLLLTNNCFYRRQYKICCYISSFFSYIKSKLWVHNILTVYKNIPNRCITVLLTGQQFVDLLPAIELLTECLIFIGSTSQVILTSAKWAIMPLSRSSDCWIDNIMSIFQTSNRISRFRKIKVYNKSVIDWFLGQQQFSMPLERICCPTTRATDPSVGSNKTAVVRWLII